MTTVEQAAREAAEQRGQEVPWANFPRGSEEIYVTGFKAGHASRDAEVAALRQGLAELEWMVPKWVPDGHPANDLFNSGWCHHLQNTEGPVKLVLMVPPVPLPGEET